MTSEARLSRLRTALGGAIRAALVVFVVVLSMRTTGANPRWDNGALIVFEDATAVIAGAVALGAVLVLFGDRVRALLDRLPRLIIDVALFAVAFWVTMRITFSAFGAVPQIQDEIAYDLLARRIANGTPVPTSPPFPEFFRIRFLVDDGRNYPLFQPGWPLLLSFFHKAKAHGLAPAFAVATLVTFTSRLAERLYGRLTSILAGALLVGSGFLQIVGGAFFAHAWAAALVVVSLERLVAALESEHPYTALLSAIASGLAAAWLFVTRLPTVPTLGVAALGAIAAYAVEWGRRPRIRPHLRRPLAAFFVVATLGPLGQMGWNLATTRHALELPQDRYFTQTEPVPSCHRLGFGKGIGCPREHPFDTKPEGYTLERAAVVTTMRWNVFRTDTWGTAWPLAIAGLLFARRMRARDAIVVGGTLATIGTYFAFYYHAIQHGARLWGDLFGPLAIWIAAAACAPFDRKSEDEPKAHVLHRLVGAAAIGLLVLVISDEFTRDMPERVANIGKTRQADRVRKNLDDAGVHGAVVYVANCIEPDRGDVVYGWASVLNATPPDSGDRLIVRDFGPEHDGQLAALYPARKHVRVDCNGRVLAYDVRPTPTVLVTEMEAKFPPDDRADCYAVIRGWNEASNRTILEIRADKPGAWARFRQHVFEAGQYDVRLVLFGRPDGGKFALVIDGVELSPPIDTKGAIESRTWAAAAPHALGAGTHTFEIRSLEPLGTHYAWIDRLELVKRP